ncbi:MAG: CPBP family intramembrane metalloprotease [Streptococcaceae bacterium]|jgi:membrane protease YdiL (CAAX protease family)|nr:CPBP family intramembrane metalloprotease [Streptococcaceae bacterium]
MKKAIIDGLKLIGFFLLTQVPMAFLMAFITLNNQSGADFSFIQLLITVIVFLAVVYLFIRWGKKRFDAQFHLSIIKDNWKIILIGFVACYGVAMLGSMIMSIQDVSNTVNQEAIDLMAAQTPMSLMWLLAGVGAPIMEEILFRLGIIESFFKNKPMLGLIISSLIFALAHTPTDIGSFVLYGGLGVVLATCYLKTRQVEVAITIHLLYNTMGVIAMYLLM